MSQPSPYHPAQAPRTTFAPLTEETWSSRRKARWAVCLLLTAGGLSYGAFHLHSSWERDRNELARAETELSKVRAALVHEQVKRGEAEQTAHALSERLSVTDSRLSEYEQEHSAVEARLGELRKVAQQFRSMVDSGHLDVVYRRGRMVVELPAQVLFPSGSADLTVDGSAALTQVAEILRDVRGRRFVVAGHTDDVPVANEKFASNWDLSVARALHVTQALIASGVSPRQLVAAGRAEFEPVAPNKSERGRRRNRRIEIVLEPQLADIEVEAESVSLVR